MRSYHRDFQQYGHPRIVVSAGDPYRAGVDWIFEYLDEKIRAGTIFHDGETIQVGWMTVLISDSSDGSLEILEPEFGSFPVRWARGVNNTVRHLMIQNGVCDQVRAQADYPSMRQSVVISPDFMSKNEEFELSRDSGEGNDSGWIFREGGYRDVNGALRSLYEVGSVVPATIPFLALPPGSIVIRSRDRLEISAGGSITSSVNNDFLKKLVESAYFSRQ